MMHSILSRNDNGRIVGDAGDFGGEWCDKIHRTTSSHSRHTPTRSVSFRRFLPLLPSSSVSAFFLGFCLLHRFLPSSSVSAFFIGFCLLLSTVRYLTNPSLSYPFCFSLCCFCLLLIFFCSAVSEDEREA